MTPEFSARLRRKPPKVARLSLSIPAHLVAWARETAKEAGVPLSRVVQVCIEDLRDAETIEAALVPKSGKPR